VAAGRSHGSRIADLLIAAVAQSTKLALYTRNPPDFGDLETLITVLAV
jgi:predicted nucleic acid-binding protein